MAVNLDSLMVLEGAVAAGEFTASGQMLSYKGGLTQEIAEMVAMMCAANSLMGKMQADSFSKISGMNWTPFRGFAVSAGDFSVCVMGNAGVFVQSAKADFNEVFKALASA